MSDKTSGLGNEDDTPLIEEGMDIATQEQRVLRNIDVGDAWAVGAREAEHAIGVEPGLLAARDQISVFGAFDIVFQAAGDIAGEKSLCEAALPGQRPVGRLTSDGRVQASGRASGKVQLLKPKTTGYFSESGLASTRAGRQRWVRPYQRPDPTHESSRTARAAGRPPQAQRAVYRPCPA